MTPDRLALAGFVLIIVGVALWSIPLAVVVAGAIMLATAVTIEAVRVIEKRKGGPGD
jgi:uncharacterized membrane protein